MFIGLSFFRNFMLRSELMYDIFILILYVHKSLADGGACL